MADNENVSLTDSANESQTSVTESQIMSGGIIHSTPVPTNKAEDNEIMKMMQTLFNEQKNEIREVQNDFNVKFDEVKNEIKKRNDNRCV